MSIGYYSLIQFCPDLHRLEAVNIGVLLLSPAHDFFSARLTTKAARVRHVFDAMYAAGHVHTATEYAKAVIDASRDEVKKVKDLQSVIDQQANFVQFTPPRMVEVEFPHKTLNELFEKLVETEGRTKPKRSVLARLRSEFSKPEFVNLIQRQPTVSVKDIPAPLTMPFGYQNGRFNLIRAVQLDAQKGHDFARAVGGIKMEGDLVYNSRDSRYGELELVVVAEAAGGSAKALSAARSLLRGSHTRFYSSEETGDLLRTILDTAKPIVTDEASPFFRHGPSSGKKR